MTSKPSIFSIIRGTHPYGLDPEDETAWCRLCLLFGLMVGLLAGITLMGG